MDTLNITITNPFSPALLIAGAICGGLILLALITDIIIAVVAKGDEDFGVFFLVVGILSVIGFFTSYAVISSYDRDAQLDRVTVAMAETGVSNVQIFPLESTRNSVITGVDSAGENLIGTLYTNSNESFTIVFK